MSFVPKHLRDLREVLAEALQQTQEAIRNTRELLRRTEPLVPRREGAADAPAPSVQDAA